MDKKHFCHSFLHPRGGLQPGQIASCCRVKVRERGKKRVQSSTNTASSSWVHAQEAKGWRNKTNPNSEVNLILRWKLKGFVHACISVTTQLFWSIVSLWSHLDSSTEENQLKRDQLVSPLEVKRGGGGRGGHVAGSLTWWGCKWPAVLAQGQGIRDSASLDREEHSSTLPSFLHHYH